VFLSVRPGGWYPPGLSFSRLRNHIIKVRHKRACPGDGDPSAHAKNGVEHGVCSLYGRKLAEERLREIPAAPLASITFEKFSDHDHLHTEVGPE
jgi:hypothetical protein